MKIGLMSYRLLQVKPLNAEGTITEYNETLTNITTQEPTAARIKKFIPFISKSKTDCRVDKTNSNSTHKRQQSLVLLYVYIREI